MKQKRLVWILALLVALALLGVVGCSSKDSPTTTTGFPATTAASPTSTSSGQSVTTSTTAFGLDENGVPYSYSQDLGTRPIVVLFYVPGGLVDEDVLKSVTELRNTYRDYTFLLYDYSVPAAYGDLAADLDVGYQPALVLLDRHGKVQKSWSGYIDKATLNQLLVNIGRE